MAYGKFAAVYDRLMADMPYAEWIGFAEECFERFGRPAAIADLGCGTGSVAIPLSEKGYRVYGIDLSDEMLAIAQDKSDRLSRSVTADRSAGETIWLQQDMREWELDGPVDAVVSFCDCINYLTEEEDVAAVFRRTFRGLKPGGLFVFDVHTAKTLVEYADHQPFVYNEEDLSYIWVCELDEDTCRIEHDLTFFAKETGGDKYERFDEIHIQRAYPLSLLKEMLAETGFKDIQVFADFGWEEADESATRAFFVARKEEGCVKPPLTNFYSIMQGI